MSFETKHLTNKGLFKFYEKMFKKGLIREHGAAYGRMLMFLNRQNGEK